MKFRLLIAFILVFVMVMPALAQDESGLSDDEQAIIDQLNAVIEASKEYTSFTSITNAEQGQILSLNVPALSLTQESNSSTVIDSVRSVSLGDTPYGVGSFTATTLANDNMTGISSSYGTTGEMRYVDGRLFYNATATDLSEDGTSSIPVEFDGAWHEAMDMGMFSEIGLDEFAGIFDDEESAKTDAALQEILSMANEVTNEAVDIEGAEYEMITVTFTGAAFTEFMLSSTDSFDPSDPMTGAMVDAMSAIEDNVFALVVFIDSDGMVAARSMTANISISLDTAMLDASLEGGTFDLTITLSQTEELHDINAEIAPVELPEGFE